MKNKRYSSQLKLEVVNRYLSGESASKLVREFELSDVKRIADWVKQYQSGNTTFKETRGKASKESGVRKGRKKKVDFENMTDKEKIEYQAMEIEILKKIYEVEASISSTNKYLLHEVISQLAYKYPIITLCDYLGVSTSTYYYHIAHSEPIYDIELANEVMKLYCSKNALGYRTITLLLNHRSNNRLPINSKKIYRIMRILKIKGTKCRRKYPFVKNTQESKHFKNVINRNFYADKSNQKWSIDITYVHDDLNTSYLVCIKDLHDKRIVSYKNSNTMREKFVLECVERAFVENKIQTDQLILHSDQGTHFASKAYHSLLKKYGVVGSHSRRGNCHDNSPIESFFSLFKREALNFTTPQNYAHTIKLTDEYIKFYNYTRPQLGLDKKTPCECFSA